MDHECTSPTDWNTESWIRRMSHRLNLMQNSANGDESQWDMYRSGDTEIVQSFKTRLEENRAGLMRTYGETIRTTEELLDLVYACACGYLTSLDLPRFLGLQYPDRDPTLGVAAFHKGLLGLLASLELTNSGLHGAARPNLRQTYEWLIIAKYYLVFGDHELLVDWREGDDVSLGRRVFPRLGGSVQAPLRTFWSDLCRYTHASTYAQQATFEIEESVEGATPNLIWIRMLIECLYHLLNTWIIPRSLKDFWKTINSSEENTKEQIRRLKLNQLLSETREWLKPPARSIVYAYRKNWASPK